MDYVSESAFQEILTSVLEECFPEIESLTKHQKKALLAVIIARMCSPSCQPDMKSQSYFSCSLISANTCTCQVIHTLIMPQFWLCVLWSLWWTLISTNCKTMALQRPVWAVKTLTRTISSKRLMPFYSEVPSPSYITRSGETCSVVMFNKTEPSRSLWIKTFLQTQALTPAK